MPKKKAGEAQAASPPQDGVPAPGSAVAKELGIALAVIYNYVKKGTVRNFKEDGYGNVAGGKGLIVDIAEVRSARGNKKARAPKSRKSTAERRVKDPDTGQTVEVKTRKLKPGTMVSYEHGRSAGTEASHRNAKPRYSVASVLAATGRLTFLDEGDKHRHYNGTQIDNTVFFTDRLSLMLAKGIARIEHPVPVLGMVLLAFVVEGKIELAQSLEDWMTANGLEVHVPELIDVDEDEYEVPAGQIIEGSEE